MDVTRVAAEVTPWVVSAAGAYGGAVLARTQEEAAEATVRWGRRVLVRMFGERAEGEDVPEELADVLADPDDTDAVAALRLRIRKTLAADPAFAVELARAAGEARVTMTNNSYGRSRQFNVGHGTINVNAHEIEPEGDRGRRPGDDRR
ncbi:hypothetical protein JOL79_29355 [Microbispora sp. RL4-1S]|uniref:Uncharacterized protein n=1 Tax=Microbispora oryzae TaxID=2806554 RepID=A0A940WV07_9ACTN|nr:hypothetical protein [Microbispora oryzae]MBP2707895.1 hypothetical protein [Microbispora oryzae]